MTTTKRRRYVLVGTGSRAQMFRDALTITYADRAQMTAICDLNPLRMRAWAAGLDPAPAFYSAGEFDRMIREQEPAAVIITTMDATHHLYVCRAMELGCDVILEKPMTTTAAGCRAIMAAQKLTGRQLTVTFNYRYAPRNSRVKELLAGGVIGDVISVHFEWLLDTKHGADYFRRWHRDKANSGGLLVHKSTHHFDLVNWWLGTRPDTVMAMGGLRFYGSDNATARGEPRTYPRATGHAAARQDPFALDMTADPQLKALYLDCEAADGYQRDQNVFGPGITIEDDVGVLVRYRNRAVLSYHLTAFAPREGYRVAFNGTRGRLDLDVVERAYVSGTDSDHNQARNVSGGGPVEVEEPVTLTVQPLWGRPEHIVLPAVTHGGHGGADAHLLRDLFSGEPLSDPLGRAAGAEDGAWSVSCGLAANQSLLTGQVVRIAELLPELAG